LVAAAALALAETECLADATPVNGGREREAGRRAEMDMECFFFAERVRAMFHAARRIASWRSPSTRA